MSKLKFFMNKKEQVDKRNKWYFVLLVDVNGRTMLNTYPDVKEHWERLNYLFDSMPSSYYMFRSSYRSGLQTQMPKYFKCLDSSLLPMTEFWEYTKKDAGRIKGTNVHVQSRFEQCFLGTEFYEKQGLVTFFGGVTELSLVLPYLDKVFVTRLNCDLRDFYPEEEFDEMLLTDEMLQGVGIKNRRIVESEISKDVTWLRERQLKERREEFFSDHIKITYSNKTIRDKVKSLPTLTDYQFEEWTWTDGRFSDDYVDPANGLKGKKKRELFHNMYKEDRAMANALRDRLNRYITQPSGEAVTEPEVTDEEIVND